MLSFHWHVLAGWQSGISRGSRVGTAATPLRTSERTGRLLLVVLAKKCLDSRSDARYT